MHAHRPAAGRRTPTARAAVGAGGDAGSSALELVLLTPLLIALIFALVQTALVWNARHLAGAAAQHGARLARAATALQPAAGVVGATGADSAVQASTLNFLRQTGGRGIAEPAVTVDRSRSSVTVTVTGTAIGVLPGTSVRIVAQSRTPVETFRP